MRAADYKSIVSVMPKEGLAGPGSKIFKDAFLRHATPLGNIGVIPA